MVPLSRCLYQARGSTPDFGRLTSSPLSTRYRETVSKVPARLVVADGAPDDTYHWISDDAATDLSRRYLWGTAIDQFLAPDLPGE